MDFLISCVNYSSVGKLSASPVSNVISGGRAIEYMTSRIEGMTKDKAEVLLSMSGEHPGQWQDFETDLSVGSIKRII